MNTEIIQPKRQDYTKKAQAAKLKMEEEKKLLKEKDDLQKFNFIKECLSKNQSVCIKLDNGVITVI